MGIAVSAFLLALGAVLTFATRVTVRGLDLDALGMVLMGAGLVVLVLSLLVWGPRQRQAAALVEEFRDYQSGPR